MKKINLNGISEILSEKELKNVMGGSGFGDCLPYGNCQSSCSYGGYTGTCRIVDTTNWICGCYI